jgi:hypothetical protein
MVFQYLSSPFHYAIFNLPDVCGRDESAIRPYMKKIGNGPCFLPLIPHPCVIVMREFLPGLRPQLTGASL